jgi:hypothetical protein
MAPDDDVLLSEFAHERLAQLRPPGAIKFIRHDLEDDDVVKLGRSFVVPAALGGEREKLVTPPKRSVRSCARLS